MIDVAIFVVIAAAMIGFVAWKTGMIDKLKNRNKDTDS